MSRNQARYLGLAHTYRFSACQYSSSEAFLLVIVTCPEYGFSQETVDALNIELGTLKMSEPPSGQLASSPNAMDDGNISGGLGNLNRWSQSTTSSNFSPNFVNHRRQESAHRLLATDNHISHKKIPSLETSPQGRFPYQISQESHGPFTRNHTSQSAIERSHMETTMPDQTELNALPKSSTNTIGPSLLRPESPLFESAFVRNDLRGQKSSPEKELFEPVPADYSTHQTSGHPYSQNDKRRQGTSQKAMLSKALQKANTAVLLDNAANFEGAMEAYHDACQLLQLVMLRSNGGEDEKLKLQEIVSAHAFLGRGIAAHKQPARHLYDSSYRAPAYGFFVSQY